MGFGFGRTRLELHSSARPPRGAQLFHYGERHGQHDRRQSATAAEERYLL